MYSEDLKSDHSKSELLDDWTLYSSLRNLKVFFILDLLAQCYWFLRIYFVNEILQVNQITYLIFGRTGFELSD